MAVYIRFEDNKQVETTTLENKPEGKDWHEAPRNFDWQKSYCLTEGGKIVERSQEDIELELLQNAKFSALSSLRAYYDNYTYRYAGYSHQKARSYAIQAEAAENILAAQESINEKDTAIIEPLAKVRGISYQHSLLGRQMGYVINLLNFPTIGKKSSFSFVPLPMKLGISSPNG